MIIVPLLDLALRNARLYRCEPEWQWDPPPFSDYDLWCVLEGRGSLEHNGITHDLRPGFGVLFQPNERVMAKHDPAFSLTVFASHFESSRLYRETSGRPIVGTILEIEMLRANAELAVRAYDEGRTGRDLAESIVVQVVRLLLHGVATGNRPHNNERLIALSLEIRSRPGINWRVSEMARSCAYSVPHFRREFHIAFGLPPMQYVIRYRILRALVLLRESRLSLQTIADSLGYTNVHFFHRQFRQLTGITPLQARAGAMTNLDLLLPATL